MDGGKRERKRRWCDRYDPDKGERSGGEVPAANCDAAGKQLCVPERASGEAVVLSGKQLGGALLQMDFQIFTKMPLHLNSKLLSNFLKKLKICKNKSCSTFQVLQISQYFFFQIQLRF
jgi:hypothetical protein